MGDQGKDSHPSSQTDDQYQDKLVVFKGKHIRRILHDDEWHFSIVDIISVRSQSREQTSSTSC